MNWLEKYRRSNLEVFFKDRIIYLKIILVLNFLKKIEDRIRRGKGKAHPFKYALQCN